MPSKAPYCLPLRLWPLSPTTSTAPPRSYGIRYNACLGPISSVPPPTPIPHMVASQTQQPVVVSYRHSCRTCGRAFQRATGLERHRRSAHSKEKPYGCEYCTQAFSRTDLLQRHVSLYHKKIRAEKSTLPQGLEQLFSQDAINLEQSWAHQISESAKQLDGWPASQSYLLLPSVAPVSPPRASTTIVDSRSTATNAISPSSSGKEDNRHDGDILSYFYSDLLASDQGPTFSVGSHASSSFSPPFDMAQSTSSSTVAPSTLGSTSSSSASNSPPLEQIAAIDLPLQNLTAPIGAIWSGDKSRLAYPDGAESWPIPSLRHLDLYRVNFANHLPFIHLSSLLKSTEEAPLDEDLIRAIAIIGANYDESLPPALPGNAKVGLKWCDYYGCGDLKARMVTSVEDLQEQMTPLQKASRRVLLRRTQTFALIQIVAMFSGSVKHMVAAKLSHGALIAIARELLKNFTNNIPSNLASSWEDWIAREEVVRTLWTVYIVDSLQSFCFHRSPWFSLSELSQIPSASNDDLWNAPDEAAFHRLFSHAETSRAGLGDINVYDLVTTLKDHTAPVVELPKCGNLSSHLLALLSIATDISSFVQLDTTYRRLVATRLQNIDWSDQFPPTQEMVKNLSHNLSTHDVKMKQQVEDANRSLGRWLTLLQSPPIAIAGVADAAKNQSHFLNSIMPWYWVCTHLLIVMERRIARVSETRGSSSPLANMADHTNLPWSTSLHHTAQHAAPSTNHTGLQLSQCLTNFLDGSYEEQVSSLEPIHLLIRVRMALDGLDGGASMHPSIGTAHFTESLPVSASLQGTCSIVALFPPLATI